MKKVDFIRFFNVLLCGFLFVFIMMYRPCKYVLITDSFSEKTIENQLENTIEKKVYRIPVVIRHEHSETVAEIPVVIPEEKESISDIPSIPFDLDDGIPSDIVPPDFDIKQVYSKIVYPHGMKKKNIEASFSVRVFVFSDGSIEFVFPDGVQTDFVIAVKQAFKGIQISPAAINGKPVDVVFSIPFSFVLK